MFKTKRGSDGKVECYKAQLIAKGYTQKHGVDYDETFSLVVCYSSIRALLAFCTAKWDDYPPNGCGHSLSKWNTE